MRLPARCRSGRPVRSLGEHDRASASSLRAADTSLSTGRTATPAPSRSSSPPARAMAYYQSLRKARENADVPRALGSARPAALDPYGHCGVHRVLARRSPRTAQLRAKLCHGLPHGGLGRPGHATPQPLAGGIDPHSPRRTDHVRCRRHAQRTDIVDTPRVLQSICGRGRVHQARGQHSRVDTGHFPGVADTRERLKAVELAHE